MLTADRLRSLLRYDPDTGHFIWRVTRTNSRPKGSRAGNLRRDGYRAISIDRRLYLEHVLAWLYVTGKMPAGEIDHADLDRAGNRWSNLRPATLSQNRANTGLRKDSSSGFKGVSFHHASGRYSARIQVDGRRMTLGFCHTAEDAARLYADAAEKHFQKFARTA